MKFKEIEVTANMAWSPMGLQSQPIYLAAGTSAQQMDASFSSSSSLDLYLLDLKTTDRNIPKAASINTESRFYKLIWGETGVQDGSRNSGVIVGGFDRGAISAFDASKILHNPEEDPLIFKTTKHTGSVQALDLNPFQKNLLASGASESEIFIWDLLKPDAPMTPGTKSQPPDEVRSVAWNRQVQHILGSTFSSRCVVWDLRKNDPIIKVSDSSSRMKYKIVAWHPQVATQLCLASEDDNSPVIQIWDLRLASSPLRTLSYHHRGIMSVDWCQQDPDLLVSCGKDEKIYIGNPNSDVIQGGDLLLEIASGSSWSFDVAWCPKNPGIIAASGFDCKVGLYTVMGGGVDSPAVAASSNALAESFPGMSSVTAPQVQQQSSASTQLKVPPKWLKRPAGANFGFGGKLVTFDSKIIPGTNGEQPSVVNLVQMHSVLTEPELIERSTKLETALSNQNYSEFCLNKINNSKISEDNKIWQFINANFEPNPRQSIISLLGYSGQIEADLESLSDALRASSLNANNKSNGDVFDSIQSNQKPIVINTEGPGSLLAKSLLTGNLEASIQLCIQENRMADALILALQSGPELYSMVKQKYFENSQSPESDLIQAVSSGQRFNFFERLDASSSWVQALVFAATYSETQEEFASNCTVLGNGLKGDEALLCYICAGDLDNIVKTWMDTKDTDSSPDKLQDMVDVIMTLKKACERLNGHEPYIKQDGPLAEKLTYYAGLLAGQGAIETASQYLEFGTVSTDPNDSMSVFRSRISGALGLSKTARVSGRQRINSRQGINLPRKMSNSYGNEVYSNYDYNRPYAPSPVPPPMSTPGYNNGPSQVNMYSLNSGELPSHPNLVPPPPLQNTVPPPNIFTPAPYSNMNGSSNLTGSTSHTNLPPCQPGGYVPDKGGPGHCPPSSNGSGWNDPPPMISMSQPRINSTTKSVSSIHPEPITQPLFQLPSDMLQSQQPTMPTVMDPTLSAQNCNYMSYQSSPMPEPSQQSYYTPSPVQTTVQPPTPVEVPKGPIPQEHQVLQDVFEALRVKCLNASNHPQIKRKLEDVGRKLEILYDKLRSGSLPEATVTGLHQLSASIISKDYNGALYIINQLVSTGSFSVLSQFLTGVKVLVQVSSQLGVYIEQAN